MKKSISFLLLFSLLSLLICSCTNAKEADIINTTSLTEDQTETETESQAENQTTNPPRTVSVRIGTYNIANGRVVDHDMKKIAEDIIEADLDIVGIQEVDRFASRSKYIDTLKLLSEYTGYEYYYYTKAINLAGDEAKYGQKGEYGTGILSKYPISETKSMKLESGSKEQRMLGYAKIIIEGQEINFYNTHLTHDDTELRIGQIKTLEKTLKDKNYCILTGDFNISGFAELRSLPSLNTTCNDSNPLSTFPSSSKSIDNILFSDEFTLTGSFVQKKNHSDHYMLYADFTFPIYDSIEK